LISLFEDQPSEEVADALGTFKNLKNLEINGKLAEVCEYLGSVATARPSLEGIRLSLPELRDQRDLDGPVFRQVLEMLNSFNDSLTTLALGVAGKKLPEGFEQGLPLSGVRLPKLQSISLWNCQGVLPMVFLIEAPLKTLTMNLPDPFHGFERFDWRALGHYGPTLEELDVSGVGRGMAENDFYALTINLPNLRVIKLRGIEFATLELLFRLSSLKKLNSFLAGFRHNSLEDSARGFELVEQKINENPRVWEMLPSLQEFSLGGEIRPANDADPRARKTKVVTCEKGKAVQIRVLDLRYIVHNYVVNKSC